MDLPWSDGYFGGGYSAKTAEAFHATGLSLPSQLFGDVTRSI
jgi:hypothetical protein